MSRHIALLNLSATDKLSIVYGVHRTVYGVLCGGVLNPGLIRRAVPCQAAAPLLPLPLF